MDSSVVTLPLNDTQTQKIPTPSGSPFAKGAKKFPSFLSLFLKRGDHEVVGDFKRVAKGQGIFLITLVIQSVAMDPWKYDTNWIHRSILSL